MLEPGTQGWRQGAARMATVASLALLFFVGGACGSPQQDDQPSQPLALPPDFPLSVGMTWDDTVVVVRDWKRLTAPIRESPDRLAVAYQFGDGAYTLTFERPTSPELGPYRIVKIGGSALPPPGPAAVDISQELKPAMTLHEALPVMKRVGGVAGGYFAFETRDRFAAFLRTDDGTDVRVTFERPNDVPRPEVISDATPEVLGKLSHIPLDALPEFDGYRVTAVKIDSK